MAQTIDEMRAAFDAFERDGKICERNFSKDPYTITTNPRWNFQESEFIPVPKPLECWANEYPDEYLNVYHTSADEARRLVMPGATRVAIHMIEDPEQDKI